MSANMRYLRKITYMFAIAVLFILVIANCSRR